MENRFLGCIYGLAIGDALGFPVEFMSSKKIKEFFGHQGIRDFVELNFPKGTFSDDTQMSLATARGLINAKGESLDELMASISNEYVAWIDDPENNRAPGHTCLRGAAKLKQGIHWRESGLKESKGCGAAMRTAPIGLYFNNDIPKLIETSYAASACTHAHPTGIVSGISTAYLVGLALNNETPNIMINRIIALGSEFDKDFAEKINQIKKVLNYKEENQALEKLGSGWTGEEAVALALYCFLRNPGDYKKTVLMAANTNGDSDSVACIAGAISGAYNGIENIPQEWIENIEKSKMLRKIAEKLYEKYQAKTNFPKEFYLFSSDLTDELFGFKDRTSNLSLVFNMPDQRYVLERAIRFRRALKPKISDILIADEEKGRITIGKRNLESRNPQDYSLLTKDYSGDFAQKVVLDYIHETGDKVVVTRTKKEGQIKKFLESIIRSNNLSYKIASVSETGYNEQLLERKN